MKEQVRILCVDDEVHVLKSLQRLFLDDDYEVITAPSALDGLQRLEEEETVQIVISDYRMPGMNGVEFLKEVCRRRPDTVRIVLSGYADTAAVVSAINEGQIYKFIPKPWNDDELKVTVANAVERYFLHQVAKELTNELRRKNEELLAMNDQLERKVADRTAELMIQNSILSLSRHILDALPVGVIGVDPEGTIVQCNNAAAAFLGIPASDLVGCQRNNTLPESVNRVVDLNPDDGRCSEVAEVGGSMLKITGIHLENGLQSGFVLQFDKANSE